MYLGWCPHTISLYMLIGRQHLHMLIFFIIFYLPRYSEKTENSTDPKLNSVILNLQLLLFSFVLDLMGDNIIYY